MNTEHIAIFLDLAKTLSFSKTALNMGVSQSAVSQTISSMEKYIGAPLFYRSRKSVVLTSVGKAFYHDILPAHKEYLKSLRQISMMNDQSKNQLKIGITGTPYEISEISGLVRKYRQENPQMKIFIETHDHRELINLLSQGLLDLIFVRKDCLKNQSNISFKSLLTGNYSVVYQKDYNFHPKEKEVSTNELRHQQLIFLKEKLCTPSLYTLQKKLGQHLDVKAIIVDSRHAAISNILAGNGIAIFSNIALPINKSELKWKRLENGASVNYGAAIQTRTLSTAAVSFQDWLNGDMLTKIE